jgi:hypothetical protein
LEVLFEGFRGYGKILDFEDFWVMGFLIMRIVVWFKDFYLFYLVLSSLLFKIFKTLENIRMMNLLISAGSLKNL